MFRHLTRTVALAAAAIFAVSACNVQNTGGGGSGGSGGNEAKDLKVGWSTIYLTPSWMQQTQRMLKADVAKLKDKGIIASYRTYNANGDTSQQIAQIRAMIQQNYDVILVDAGSSTALNPVLEQAVSQGITVVNFDSLVSTKKVVRVNTDQKEWGRMLAEWLIEEIGGKGKIIAFNGPAGVAVSEARWSGAKEVLDQHPEVKVVANLNSEYNLAPAAQKFASSYSAHPDIDGVLSLGGALSAAALRTIAEQGGEMVPITGENYNGFLKAWADHSDEGFTSISTAQPNYLAVIALRAAVAKIKGASVPNFVDVPLPRITSENLDEWVQPDKPDDYYAIQPLPQDEINKLIGVTDE